VRASNPSHCDSIKQLLVAVTTDPLDLLWTSVQDHTKLATELLRVALVHQHDRLFRFQRGFQRKNELFVGKTPFVYWHHQVRYELDVSNAASDDQLLHVLLHRLCFVCTCRGQNDYSNAGQHLWEKLGQLLANTALAVHGSVQQCPASGLG
jgi:hypothetical protein